MIALVLLVAVYGAVCMWVGYWLAAVRVRRRMDAVVALAARRGQAAEHQAAVGRIVSHRAGRGGGPR